jgi:hypothetical protein
MTAGVAIMLGFTLGVMFVFHVLATAFKNWF